MSSERAPGVVGVDTRLVGQEVLVDGESRSDGSVGQDVSLDGLLVVGQLVGGLREGQVVLVALAVAGDAGLGAGGLVCRGWARAVGSVDVVVARLFVLLEVLFFIYKLNLFNIWSYVWL